MQPTINFSAQLQSETAYFFGKKSYSHGFFSLTQNSSKPIFIIVLSYYTYFYLLCQGIVIDLTVLNRIYLIIEPFKYTSGTFPTNTVSLINTFVLHSLCFEDIGSNTFKFITTSKYIECRV